MPERRPTVTVVIPVYNRAGYLGATVESVLAQTEQGWELIVVDDGSEEDVGAVLDRYPDERIKLVRQENQGNAAARNTGISRARGEYVICLDSDDVWDREMLAACLARLRAGPDLDVAYCQVQRIDAQGRLLPRPLSPDPRNGDLLEPLLMGFGILPSSALVRRACYERWGAFTPGLDDWEMWLRWAARGCRFGCVERPLLSYRIHDRNLNLAWKRRHQVHFAMLDAFYRLEDLPARAWDLREQAYAGQHFVFAVQAWQAGRSEDGVAEFVRAAKANPDFLRDVDFYTRIACGHQGRLDAGTPRNLDLGLAEGTLDRCLGALFAAPDLPADLKGRQATARAWAYLALGRLAYGVPRDKEAARRFLLRAVATWPPIAWRTDWAVWLGRSVIGFEAVQRLKGGGSFGPQEGRDA